MAAAKRSPEADPAGAPTVAALLSDVDRTRRRLYALLRSHDARALSSPPPSGAWSVIENVRHLVFAEQVHLGKFLPGGSAWSPMTLSPRTGKTFAVKSGAVIIRYEKRQLLAEYAGAQPKDDLEGVLGAWDLIHRPVRNALKANTGDAQHDLARHLAHLRRHFEIIEKQLARTTKDA